MKENTHPQAGTSPQKVRTRQKDKLTKSTRQKTNHTHTRPKAQHRHDTIINKNRHTVEFSKIAHPPLRACALGSGQPLHVTRPCLRNQPRVSDSSVIRDTLSGLRLARRECLRIVRLLASVPPRRGNGHNYTHPFPHRISTPTLHHRSEAGRLQARELCGNRAAIEHAQSLSMTCSGGRRRS